MRVYAPCVKVIILVDRSNAARYARPRGSSEYAEGAARTTERKAPTLRSERSTQNGRHDEKDARGVYTERRQGGRDSERGGGCEPARSARARGAFRRHCQGERPALR